jgi:retinol dehydrogenase-12
MKRAQNDVDLTGRSCLVTGATSGIGEETALALARMGARVGILARSEERARQTLDRIARETGRSDLEIVIGDLGSLAAVRAAAAEVLQRFESLHVLVNNAGLIQLRRETSADGFETTFAVNHLGPFLLTNLLLERIIASRPARIVNVASHAHRFAKRGLDLDDLQNEREFKSFRVYGQSKLANILFTRELARRVEREGVTVNALHPGGVATRFGTQNGRFARIVMKLGRAFLRSPARGAETSIHLASATGLEGVTGRYFANRREVAPSADACNDELAAALWARSVELSGLDA